MDMDIESLRWDSGRRFGVEAEINAFDGKSRPDDRKTPPAGIVEVADLMVSRMGQTVNVTKWMATHNNNCYVIKPDGSCGMEVCTPVLKGWNGLEQVCRMTESFQLDTRIRSDERCSLHVHVNVADCLSGDVGNIAAHWIKCEPVFLDSMPARRKRSRYCQVIGMCDMFDINENFDPKLIIKRMGECKYYSLNDFHYAVQEPSMRRDTVEFRLAENDACVDSFYAKNWVRLVVHFVDMAKRAPWPGAYVYGNPKTGLAWLDPIDVFELLGFMPGQYKLSPGLKQTRNWFFARMNKNIFSGNSLGGIWAAEARRPARRQLDEILSKIFKEDGESDIDEWLYPSNLEEALYDEKYRV